MIQIFYYSIQDTRQYKTPDGEKVLSFDFRLFENT